MAQKKRVRDDVAGDDKHPAQEEQPAREDLWLMRLAPGERFYKFYILTERRATPQQRVEHRILTKEHTDGSLEMVSYNAWFADGHSEKRDVIRVPSLSKALLDQIVERVRTQSAVPAEGFREIDLSRCETVADQLSALAGLGI